MEPIDITTPQGRAAWSNAMLALDAAIAEQDAKVASIQADAERKPSSSSAESLAREERILKALQNIRRKELARTEGR